MGAAPALGWGLWAGSGVCVGSGVCAGSGLSVLGLALPSTPGFPWSRVG